MSNAMTEEEVRTKFGDLFDTAYELLDNNDKHDLVMLALQSFAESDDDFKEFMTGVKEAAKPLDSTDKDDEEKLVDWILEEFGTLHPDELDKLVGAVAKRFLDDPPRRACDHGQLYAHATIDVVLPVTHNSATSMVRILDRIFTALVDTELSNYRVRSGIEVDEIDTHE